MSAQCPACGAEIDLVPASDQPWKRATSFDAGSGITTSTWTRETPARDPTQEGDVIVPLLQTCITSVAVGALVAVAAFAFGWSRWIPLGAMALAFLFVWLLLLTDHRSLLRIVETFSNEPDTTPVEREETIRLVPVTGRGAQSLEPPPQSRPRLFELPDGRTVEQAKVLDMIIGANTVGLALDVWKVRGWSRSTWETARDVLGDYGIATPRERGQAATMILAQREARQRLGL